MSGSGRELLNEDQTISLLKQAQNGDFYAKEELISANMRLVHSIVRRYAACGHDPEDLFQVGCIGLLKAVEKFDFSYQVCFSTYAVPLILGEIRRYIRDDSPLSVSRTLKERAVLIERARRDLLRKLNREPKTAEIAEFLHLTLEQVLAATQAMRPVLSINEQHNHHDGTGYEMMEKLKDMSLTDDDALLERINMDELMGALPKRWAHIIKRRYFQDMTQIQVAKELGVSQVQISRLEKKALKQLREKMSQ